MQITDEVTRRISICAQFVKFIIVEELFVSTVVYRVSWFFTDLDTDSLARSEKMPCNSSRIR